MKPIFFGLEDEVKEVAGELNVESSWESDTKN